MKKMTRPNQDRQIFWQYSEWSIKEKLEETDQNMNMNLLTRSPIVLYTTVRDENLKRKKKTTLLLKSHELPRFQDDSLLPAFNAEKLHDY